MLRYKICSFLLLIISLLVFNNIKANDLLLYGKVIYIDIGHGGNDPGAIVNDVYEAPINLQIGKKIANKLIKLGATVYMTRYDDYDLSKPNAKNHKKSDLNSRIKLINETNPDLVLSIHLNCEKNSNWNGAQVFYDNINENNKIIAQIFQNEFKTKLKSNRKIKQIYDLYLFRNLKTPSVLLEVGFLSNSYERNLLKTSDYQDKVSDAIVSATIKYFKSK